MFYAARSGKQHLAFECLESRHLLSADFGAVDFHDDFAKQAPAPAIIAIAPTAQRTGRVEPFEESKGQVAASFNNHHPQQLANHFGSFESDDLETDDADPDDYDREQETVFVGAIRSALIIGVDAHPSVVIRRSELPAWPPIRIACENGEVDSRVESVALSKVG